jgi:hypothetical protein
MEFKPRLTDKLKLHPAHIFWSEYLPNQLAERVAHDKDGLDYWQKILPPPKPQPSHEQRGKLQPGFPTHVTRPETLGASLIASAKWTFGWKKPESSDSESRRSTGVVHDTR